MTTLAVIQARMGSTRFPGKVLADLCGKPVIQRVYERVREAVPNVVVACPAGDTPIVDYCRTHDIPVFAWDGPENDCLGRIAACLEAHPADVVVRITADCPLIEPWRIHAALDAARVENYRYYRNIVPHGQDVDVWDAVVLRAVANDVTDPWCREHVKPYRMPEPDRPPGEPTEVNTPEDLDRIRRMLCEQRT